MAKPIRVLVGIQEAYTREKIIECFKHRDNNYQVDEFDDNNNGNSMANYDFFWLEYEDLDFEKLLNARKKMLNSFCIRKGLIRKAQLAYYMRKYAVKNPNAAIVHWLPETYIFELDHIDYLDEALNECFEVEQALEANLTANEKKKFILKSSMTNKGAEILIFDTREQLVGFFERRVQESEDEGCLDLREWVIQAYLQRPLLLESYQQRKFHLRVYVVAVSNLRVYVYDDILALFSLVPFAQDTMQAHITNTCVQLDDSSNKETAEAQCVHRFWQLQDLTQEQKERIFDQVKSCTGEIFKCLRGEPAVFQPMENAFEIYGLDFLVDDQHNILFLEANAFPDFKQTGNALNDLISRLFYQTIAVAADSHFNIPPVCDSKNMHLVLNTF